jgi:hypothetical protein
MDRVPELLQPTLVEIKATGSAVMTTNDIDLRMTSMVTLFQK